MAVDGGTVWAATAEGLARFDGERWTTLYTREDGSAVRPGLVAGDEGGWLWAARHSDDDRPARVVRFGDGGGGGRCGRWTTSCRPAASRG